MKNRTISEAIGELIKAFLNSSDDIQEEKNVIKYIERATEEILLRSRKQCY